MNVCLLSHTLEWYVRVCFIRLFHFIRSLCLFLSHRCFHFILGFISFVCYFSLSVSYLRFFRFILWFVFFSFFFKLPFLNYRSSCYLSLWLCGFPKKTRIKKEKYLCESIIDSCDCIANKVFCGCLDDLFLLFSNLSFKGKFY